MHNKISEEIYKFVSRPLFDEKIISHNNPSYPKISVVTSSYNQGRYLENTILSVLNQNYPNLEYVIIDGGSTDNSTSIIKKYEKFLACWISEKDSGCPDALNKGLSKITGDIYYYLNSDDYLLPNSFHRVARFITEYPSYDVYLGHGLTVDELRRSTYKIYSSCFDLNRYISGRCSIVQQGTFFRTDIFRSGILFNKDNKSCWDAELLVDLCFTDAKFIRLPFDYILAAFRVHESSITGSKSREDQYKSDIQRINKKIQKRYPHIKPKGNKAAFLAELFLDPGLMSRRAISRIGLGRI